MHLARSLTAAWYAPRVTPLAALLWPLSLLYRVVSGARRFAYRAGWRRAERAPVPVVVVGNITAGGTGKTPIVRALVAALAARGFHPGIVSRGYGSRRSAARIAAPGAAPEVVGDEPAMLAGDGFPVAVGARRIEAVRALLQAHPGIDVIVSDDGLQHYALDRDVEIAVIDAERRFGNGLQLPAGPLREPVSRLRDVDAIVWRGSGTRAVDVGSRAAVFEVAAESAPLRSVLDPQRTLDVVALRGLEVQAVAGIGDPERFFAQLRALGLTPVCHAFPDHHRFKAGDLEWRGASAIVMTEKDAVKCRAFADARTWFLPLRMRIDPALTDLVEEAIRGSQAA
jgi:tetraacyldisaccharide 4'-kinase